MHTERGKFKRATHMRKEDPMEETGRTHTGRICNASYTIIMHILCAPTTGNLFK